MKSRRLNTVLTAMIALLIAMGCATQQTTEDSANNPVNAALVSQARYWTPAPEYIVEPPDELRIMVKDNPELRTDTVVRPDGRVSVQLIGDVFVAGRTVAQIEKEIEGGLARYIRNVNVTVAVTGFKSKQVFVYGEVMRPGAYPYTGRDTVVKAIAEAGTLNWRAAPNGIQVTRGDPNNPTILPVRLKDIVIDDDDITNYYLQANDIIWVPPTTIVKVGDVLKEVFWPIQWAVAPATVYTAWDSVSNR